MNNQISVLGAGESGVGAAILAKKKGFKVFVSDIGKIKQYYKEKLEKNKIEYEEKQHTKKRIFESSLIIKSPGIPDEVALIVDLKSRNIPVISEIEFASRFTDATILAITGSNGKTTTTNLTYHLLNTAGLNVGIGGNVGISFAQLVAEQPKDFFVLELSSFQLDGIQSFRPNISILLNITPDHLDRYEYKLKNYIQSKFRITKNQKASDIFIFNGEDKNIKDYLQQYSVKSKKLAVPFSLSEFYDESNPNILRIDDSSTFDLSECSLKGQHNRFNIFCAIKAAKTVGVPDVFIQQALNTFVNDPHRLEVVKTIADIEYINDSKATNIDAVYYALAAMKKPIVWIVGGIDKGNDYELIMDLVTQKVKAIICLGADNTKIVNAFSNISLTFRKKRLTIEETQNTLEAVQLATKHAEAGDVVLLSPACSSFDLFNNYKHRGDEFKKAVRSFK